MCVCVCVTSLRNDRPTFDARKMSGEAMIVRAWRARFLMATRARFVRALFLCAPLRLPQKASKGPPRIDASDRMDARMHNAGQLVAPCRPVRAGGGSAFACAIVRTTTNGPHPNDQRPPVTTVDQSSNERPTRIHRRTGDRCGMTHYGLQRCARSATVAVRMLRRSCGTNAGARARESQREG